MYGMAAQWRNQGGLGARTTIVLAKCHKKVGKVMRLYPFLLKRFAQKEYQLVKFSGLRPGPLYSHTMAVVAKRGYFARTPGILIGILSVSGT
jgi:hypothetical protein